MRDEQAVRLAAALAKLPDDQSEAVRLRHLEGFTLAELAARFSRSEDAVAALLKRGLENLRKRLRH
jgi:RNA polymerase sigma-70 factor (ECF subfamily)